MYILGLLVQLLAHLLHPLHLCECLIEGLIYIEKFFTENLLREVGDLVH